MYTDKFIGTDNLINHLASVIGAVNDPEIKASYAGFLSVSGVTVYELAIKDIFYEFAKKKNKVLATVVEAHFNRINGRIKIDHLKDQHIKLFGDKYLTKFKKILATKEDTVFSSSKVSITSSYCNLINCRHQFVHNGSPTLTLNEAIDCYLTGKEVISCLDEAMRR